MPNVSIFGEAKNEKSKLLLLMDGLQPAWLETLIFHFSLFTFFTFLWSLFTFFVPLHLELV